MAIRERKGRKSPWQCYWNNPITGKRESANFASRLEAEKHDSLIKHRIRFDRKSFQKEAIEAAEPEATTLESCYLLYLREKQFSKTSLQWQMDAMREPLKKMGTLRIESITRQHLETIMQSMLTRSIKPVTVRGRMSVLRTVIRWCAAKGLREPLDFPKLPPAQYEKFIPPTPDELAAIITNAQPHIVRVVVLGAQLGVRVGPSELLRLTWDDVDFERMVVRVHGSKKNRHEQWREVPIRAGLQQVFEKWFQEDAKDGVSSLIHFKGQPVRSIRTAWTQTLKRAGITRRIRPYDLRHAFATELIAGGVDVGTVAKLMGHTTPTMIFAHYQHVMDSQKRSAVEALPDIKHVSSGMCPKQKSACHVVTSA